MAKYFKAGDTLPAITDTLLDENGTALNVSGCTVYFMSRISGQSEFRVLGEATLVSGPSGQVAYYWSGSGADGDLALAGSYQYEWEVHRPSTSGVYTVPTASWGTYTVYDDIGTANLAATQTSGTVNVSATFLDTQGVALGVVPPGAKVFAYLGTQPVAYATATASGNYSLTLVDGLTYGIQAQWPGYTFGTKTIAT